MTAVPAYTRTWTQKLTTGTPGARITFVSLLDTMQNYLFGIKSFLTTGGLSVVWSASGGTGPTNSSDHTDRWSNAAAVTPRATIAGASQAWVVLLDGNGGQLLLAFQGASDDIARISYSPGALYTLAGTTNQQPTATDELPISTATTLIGATASADRVWHGLVSSDAKAYRFTILRSSVVIGQTWSVENFTLATLPGSVTCSPAVMVTCFGTTQIGLETLTGFHGGYGANAAGALARAVISSVGTTVQCSLATWGFNSNSAGNFITGQPELQGTNGYLPWPSILLSVTTGGKGFLGTPIDFWTTAPSGFAVGDGFGSTYEWWQVGVWLWPNPSNTAPTIA
jgi:hypothetical protein